MAVDSTGEVTTKTHEDFTFGDKRVVFGLENLGGINPDTVIIPSAPARIAETTEEKRKQRQTDAAIITSIQDVLNDTFFIEETNTFIANLWQGIINDKEVSPFDILKMNREELYDLIKKDKEAWNAYIDKLQEQYPNIPREELEQAVLKEAADQLIKNAHLEINNRIERTNAKALETMQQGLAMVFKINQNISPQDIIHQLQNSIEASQADFDGMVELAQEMRSFLEKHGPNPELAAQLEALDAAMEGQSALITFNVEIKAFFDTHHEAFPNMTAEQIMVRAMIDKDLMEAYAEFSEDIDAGQLQQIALRAGEALGLTPQDVKDYFALMEKTQAAADVIKNTLAKLSTGSKAVFNTSQIGTDGLDKNAIIFRDYNGNFVTINYRTGAETQITQDHIISAIITAEADPYYNHSFKVGHPDEMMELKKAFSDAFDASIEQLQQGMAQQEAIAKTAHQTETEQTEIETPEMTPDELQQYITDNKSRIIAIFEANPDGISPDMLKYGLAQLGLQPGNDLDRAMAIVSKMPEANIIDPAASPAPLTPAPRSSPGMV